MSNTLFFEAFEDIRHFILLMDKSLLGWDDSKESQYEHILEYLDDVRRGYRTDDLGIYDTYNTKLIDAEGMYEEHGEGSYNTRSCFWIVEIDKQLFRISGTYQSEAGTTVFWDQIEKVESKINQASVEYIRKIN